MKDLEAFYKLDITQLRQWEAELIQQKRHTYKIFRDVSKRLQTVQQLIFEKEKGYK